MKCTDIELELVNYFNPRSSLIIPNVAWGFNIHECDLIVVSTAGFITEVEIKISKADIKADLKKRHKHFDTRIKRLFFAIPYYLEDCADLIPEDAGILTIGDREGKPWDWKAVVMTRRPKDKSIYKCTTEDRRTLARLGTLRMWSLKKELKEQKERFDRLYKKMKSLGIQTEMFF